MKLIQVMLLSFSLVAQATGEYDVIGSDKPIKVVVGDDVILPCHVEPQFYVTNLTVEWRLNKTKVHVYRSGADDPTSQDQRFKDRTSLSRDEMASGNISLKLTNVTQNDAGNYTCIVPKLQGQFKKGKVSLIVAEPNVMKKKIDGPGQDAGIGIGEYDVIGSHEPIEVVVGDDVILPCHVEPQFYVTNLTVKWRLDVNKVHVYRSGADDPFSQDQRFKDRTSLFLDEMAHGNISLKLTNVTQNDAGNFTCIVPKLQGQFKKGNVMLIVAEPNVMKKKIDGPGQDAGIGIGEPDVIGSHEPIEVVVGDDVILPCHVEPQFDVTHQTVKWRLDENKVHVYRSGADDPFSQDQRFKDRTSLFLDEMAHGNISLKLTNVTQNDAGNYTCIVPKLQGQFKKGNVRLIVEPRTTKDEKKKIDGPF